MIASFQTVAEPLKQLDEFFDSLRAYFTFTRDVGASVALNVAIRGGRYAGSTYADTTITLGASTTTYVEADTSAHTIVANTTGYSGGTKKPIGIATTNANGLTTWVQDFTVATT